MKAVLGACPLWGGRALQTEIEVNDMVDDDGDQFVGDIRYVFPFRDRRGVDVGLDQPFQESRMFARVYVDLVLGEAECSHELFFRLEMVCNQLPEFRKVVAESFGCQGQSGFLQHFRTQSCDVAMLMIDGRDACQ